jgi:translation initiation factor 2-alpha kinase 4
VASGAELIAVANDCLNSFPNLAQNYEIHVSHSKSQSCLTISFVLALLISCDLLVIELVLTRLPSGQQDAVVDIMSQTKSSLSQKRNLLLKRGLLRSTADELEVLAEIGVPVHLCILSGVLIIILCAYQMRT